MERTCQRRWGQVKTILWLIVMVDMLVLCLAVIVGGVVGYAASLKAHAWLAVLVSAGLLVLLLGFLALDPLLTWLDRRLSASDARRKAGCGPNPRRPDRLGQE